MKPHTLVYKSLIILLAATLMMLPGCKKKEKAALNTATNTNIQSTTAPTPDPNLEKASNIIIEEGIIEVDIIRPARSRRSVKSTSAKTVTTVTYATTASALVDDLNRVYGTYPGKRAMFAKGFCAVGSFTPTSGGQMFGSSPVFAGGPYKTDFRMSMGGGNPNVSDKSQQVKGFAVRIYLPDGSEWDMPMISAPMFSAATPEQYAAFLNTIVPDPSTGKPNPDKLNTFRAANPNTAAYLDYVESAPVPASYGTLSFYTTHAYIFDAPNGTPNNARLMLNPTAGIQSLSDDQLQSYSDNFLESEFAQRLNQGNVSFDMKALLRRTDESLTDPSAQWPIDSNRGMVTVGRFIITSINDCGLVAFSPDRMPAGVKPQNDPIFAAQSAAYAESLRRRSDSTSKR